MIIVKTKDADVYINEQQTQVVQHLKEKRQVIVRSEPNGLNCNINDVECVTYTNEAQPTQHVAYSGVQKPDNYESLRLVDLDIRIPFHWIRFLNAVKPRDIETVGQLLKVSPEKVIAFRNSGPKCVAAVQYALKEKYGIEWK